MSDRLLRMIGFIVITNKFETLKTEESQGGGKSPTFWKSPRFEYDESLSFRKLIFSDIYKKIQDVSFLTEMTIYFFMGAFFSV